jgi:hypothetical protein
MAECPGPILHTVKCQQVCGAVNLYAFFIRKGQRAVGLHNNHAIVKGGERGFGRDNNSLKSIKVLTLLCLGLGHVYGIFLLYGTESTLA